MNSGLRPLPRSMPFLVRADLMVKRGEAKSFSEAVRMLRTPRPSNPPITAPRQVRLPYRDE